MPKIEWRWPWEKPPRPVVKPPKVGGTRAPDQVEAIDFTRPHDFHFSLRHDGPVVVFAECLLVGFTTPISDGDDSQTPRWEEYAHNRWLVLQRPDGRRIYVPRDQLLYIESCISS